MSSASGQPGKSGNEVNQSLVIGAVAGQVGCLTLIIVVAALFLGLWLDQYFGTKPVITLVIVTASIPVTLFVMFWVVRRVTSRYLRKNKNQEPATQEDLRSE